MKKGLIALLAVSSLSSAAFALDMSCIVSVYKAEDFLTENAPTEKIAQVVTVDLKNGEGEKEVVINGEKVTVTLYKKEFADVYNFSAILTTPEADRLNRTSFVAVASDYLVNEGPAKDNGWTTNYKPGATEFSYMNRQNGTLALTPKLVKALKADGKWGTYPYDSFVLDVGQSYDVAKVVKELLNAKKLKNDDVLALATVFSCTLNK